MLSKYNDIPGTAFATKHADDFDIYMELQMQLWSDYCSTRI